MLKALLDMPLDPNVRFHSIIGSTEPGGKRETSDGVVTYQSSHFEPVDSEKVVRSGHGVQEVPAAILEVRRILLEHLSVDLASRGEKPDVARP